MAEMTPMMKQYLEIKEQNKDAILMFRLGEIVYENAKKDEPDMAALEDKIAEIDLALDAIEELKATERKLKKTVACPSCGEDVDEGANFCSKCGCNMN